MRPWLGKARLHVRLLDSGLRLNDQGRGWLRLGHDYPASTACSIVSAAR